jgi:hypothetical protein
MDILEIVSTIDSVATTGNKVVELLNNVKKLLSSSNAQGMTTVKNDQQMNAAFPPMTAFNSQMSNPYGQGNQWLPNLLALAQQHGNSWVPETTQPLLGIDLTGVWTPPFNLYDQTFIRQYGPSVNFVSGIGGTPTAFGEGLFDPIHRIVHVVGRNMYGWPIESRGQLLPNWMIQGMMTWVNQFGQPIQTPYIMSRIA